MHDPRSARLGLLYGLGAYGLWGVIPLYFRQVRHVPAVDVLAHRALWSFAVLAACILLLGRSSDLLRVRNSRRVWGPLVLSTLLIACNWFTYIYAVSREQVLEASLGYFITPLANVAMGVFLLRERLRPLQVVAIALAALAVGSLTYAQGALPWIALSLAMSFSTYGLVRKLVAVDALVGLFVETALLAPLAVIYLYAGLGPAWGWSPGMPTDPTTLAWLAAGGPITTVPLLFFAGAARRLALTTLGFLQYLAPTLQFTVAVTLFGERLDPMRVVCFAGIWTAIAIYTLDALRATRAP